MRGISTFADPTRAEIDHASVGRSRSCDHADSADLLIGVRRVALDVQRWVTASAGTTSPVQSCAVSLDSGDNSA
jgi:hypothetical protein